MPDGIRLGGAFYELTADDSKLIQTLARTQSQAKSFSEAIAKSMGAASGSTDAAMKTMAASTQQAAAATRTASSGWIQGAAALLQFQGAANLAEQALTSITAATLKASQVQFQLVRQYGTSTGQATKFANDLAAATGQSNLAVQEGIARFGVLMKGYGLTRDQVEKLAKATIDLAAATGTDTVEAFERMIGVFRDGGESAEKLGLVLNDQSVKAFANLTAEQRKNFEQMDALQKSQIRYTEAMKQAAAFEGSAADKATTLAGAWERLQASGSNLAVSLGEAGAGSSAKSLLGSIQAVIDGFDAFIKKTDETEQAIKELQATGQLPWYGGAIASILDPAAFDAQIAAIRARPQGPQGPDPGMPGGTTGGLSHAAAAQAIQAIAEERRKQAEKDLKQADKTNKAIAESAITAIDAEKRAKERWYDEERSRIEARRTYQLEDIETRKQAALDALAAEKQAALDAIDDQIKDQERLKQVRLDAAEAAADAAKAAIAAEKERLDVARELENRARDDEREAEDRARAATRRDEERARSASRLAEDRTRSASRLAEDRTLKQSQEDEIRGLEALTEARKQAVEDGIALLEKATEKRIRALDREADKARTNGEKALTRLERQGEAEDEAHRKRMQALEDEQDARLKILDAQLAALDAEERSADAARRTADLQTRIASAQKAQVAAHGTGTPEEIDAAREELTRALRVGNEVSVANARERLVELAGQGNEAIEKADTELADAQQELRDQGVDDARDAEKAKLQAAKDAVAEEIDARKRAEDDSDRARKQDLELAQEHERSKLAATLDRLEKQKQGVQDNAADEKRDRQERGAADEKAQKEHIRLVKEQFAADGQVLKDRREAEDQLRDDTRTAEDQLRQDEREAQDQVRADEREAQDRFRADERDAQDADLARQLAAVQVALEAERRATEEHYNGPNGIITQLKKARVDSEREYSARLAAVTAAYAAERKAAELLYHNPEGTGALDLLQKQRQAEIDALEARKAEYQAQAAAFHEMIVAMLADIDAFIAKQQSIPQPGGGAGSPGSGSRAAGSGKATSASTTTSTSGKSGKQVQGTLGTWLNDAMDITGVGDDWAKGLYELVRRESGGDPHNQNPQDVIDPKTGKNLGNAKGLLQMLNPTFAAYRNKDLPNDIFDPVANAVASIRYIIATYGHVKNIPGLFSGTFHGYAAGGMIREPVVGMGLRSGQPYSIAEYGPEYVMSRRATSAMVGSGAGSASRGMGGFLGAAHPGGGSGYADNSSINVYGAGTEEVLVKLRREQHRQSLLRGPRRLR